MSPTGHIWGSGYSNTLRSIVYKARGIHFICRRSTHDSVVDTLTAGRHASRIPCFRLTTCISIVFFYTAPAWHDELYVIFWNYMHLYSFLSIIYNSNWDLTGSKATNLGEFYWLQALHDGESVRKKEGGSRLLIGQKTKLFLQNKTCCYNIICLIKWFIWLTYNLRIIGLIYCLLTKFPTLKKNEPITFQIVFVGDASLAGSWLGSSLSLLTGQWQANHQATWRHQHQELSLRWLQKSETFWIRCVLE